MTSLFRHAELKPHGDRLLTSSAEFWLFSARMLVLAMAGAEALAWGYLGFLFGEGSTRWVGAAIAGSVIFVVVWMIDASLITMDRAWREHATALLGRPDSADRGRLLRTTFTFVVRIALLIGSLTVTAPYLAQVVFYKDIQRFIDADATTKVDAARRQVAQQVDAQFDAQIEERSKQVERQRVEFESEVAGKGRSGRYGLGPAALAMRDELDRAIAEQKQFAKQVADEKVAALAKYDALARDWRANRDQLAASYNVTLPQTSILENRRALDELRKLPENRATEFAIKAFLSFIFAGLLLLKLFEPSTVRLYMSEVLQQEYVRYLAGTFDDLLPRTEGSRVKPSPMTPQRLYEFLANVWVPRLHQQTEEAQQRARSAAARRSLGELKQIEDQVGGELRQLTGERHAALERGDAARQSLVELRSAIEIVNGDIVAYEKQLARWTEEEKTFDEETRYEQSKIRRDTRQKLADAMRTLESLRENQPGEEGKVARADDEVKRLDRKIIEKENELASLSKQIRETRIASSAADLPHPA